MAANTVKEQQEIYDPSDRYEIIDGVRYDLKPSPLVDHQVLIGGLYTALHRTCQPNGIILFAPMDVYLDDNNIIQPDVIFILNKNAGIITRKRIEGAPDLLVEILSPSTANRDKIRKKALYERFGLKEYWIADPVHHTIDRFVLEQDKLQLRGVYGEGDTLTSELFACVSIDMTALFAPLARFQDME
nr:Uma2 family endonuclease [Paenibacillus hamazuiensis]